MNSASVKRYGVLFTCLTTRAVHLELVHDKSTDTFLLALRRFISRRGFVKVLRSDNVSNFIGAEKELKEEVKQLKHSKIIDVMSRHNIEWKFNPPISPWMGRLWESLVKSVKRALRVITQDPAFTEDSLTTFLCEVESVINQSPLTPTSDSIDDFDAIAPYHFLLGSLSPNLPPGNFSQSDMKYRAKWKNVQSATNIFCHRWIKEYLPTLVNQKKWTTKYPNLETGDLVIIPFEHAARSHWSLGRIVDVYPGKGKIVRSAKVRTPNVELVRPSVRCVY